MYITRSIQPKIQNSRKSVLLLGPRQVGKSTLIRQLKPELTLNLADETLFIELATDLRSFKDYVEKKKYKSIFVDEIQRIPALLNLIQVYIDESSKTKFYLTGSSARKLRRGSANLLPGRVINYYMGTITAREVGYSLKTEDVLSYGSLPEIFTEPDVAIKRDLLRSYSVGYLKEEIQEEALVRSLSGFARFFQAACDSTGQFIDYTKLSKQSKVSRHAIPRYFEILEDTLVGMRLGPFEEALESADLIKHQRFFLFDNGVYNGLLGNFTPSSDRKGILLEQLILNQIQSTCWSLNKTFSAANFRTRGGFEIDFIFKIDGEVFPVEVKTSDSIDESEVKNLVGFKTYYPKTYSPFVFHAGKKEFKRRGVWCLPWQMGLKEIGL